MKGAAGLTRFQGKPAREGPQSGEILGSFSFRGEIYPARLEHTESDKLPELKPSAIAQEYLSLAREEDPAAKVREAP